MDDNKIFRKIVEWMISKNHMTTNDLLAMSGLTIEEFAVVTGDQIADLIVKGSVKAKVQDFNKKHYDAFCLDQSTSKLPDEAPIYKNAMEDPRPAQVLDVKEAEQESMATHDLLKNPERVERRKAERIQEKVFHESLQRLRDVCPDHMTFDIMLKHK